MKSSNSLYPEREERRIGKVDYFMAAFGNRFSKLFHPKSSRFEWILPAVNALSNEMSQLKDDALLEASNHLGQQLRRHGNRNELIARAFAMIREVAARRIGLRHLDVQLIGGLALLSGMVAEMETGEGKTLTATLPAITLAMGGIPVHIITVNDYLAERDAEWMAPVYKGCGRSVGTIVHGMSTQARRAAYRCDVTYCSNKEVAFDYLRDRIILWDRPSATRMQIERLYGDASRLSQLTMRGLHFAIVDEADSVLIDEARTPLIISTETGDIFQEDIYAVALKIAASLNRGKDFTIESDRTILLTATGKARVRARNWADVNRTLNPEQRETLIRQALTALHLFDLDRHYLIKDGKVQIIDEYTGRLMADRSWERGLHQLIELKEGCEMTRRKDTRARISYQRFFRRYLGISGMTGTAREVAAELWSIYRLKVVSIPTNKPVLREELPLRWFATANQKWHEVVNAIRRVHDLGRPVLVGTRSVEASEHLSGLMTAAGLPHSILNARQDKEEAEIISKAGEKGRITVATNMAGRGTDIKLAHGVAKLGGLCVLATELHDARRIDRQLFGRCARQGDPGAAQAFVSLEDELHGTHTGKFSKWMLSALSRLPLSGLSHALGKQLTRNAQLSAERLHARARRELLKMDEQIGDSLAFTGRPE